MAAPRKPRRPRSTADHRLDAAQRKARATACRLDAVTPGAGDVLRDRVAAAIDAAVKQHSAELTKSSALSIPR